MFAIFLACSQRLASKRSKGRAFAKQQYVNFVAVRGPLGHVLFDFFIINYNTVFNNFYGSLIPFIWIRKFQ
jgi:hypothetical protein